MEDYSENVKLLLTSESFIIIVIKVSKEYILKKNVANTSHL